MSKVGSLDTNVLLRLLLNDIPAQHKLAEKLYENSSEQFMVADAAFVEIVFVLARAYDLDRAQVSDLAAGLIDLPKLNCNRPLLKQALKLYENHPKLSFEDCCLVTYAELNNATPLWTFDKKLATQSDNARLIT